MLSKYAGGRVPSLLAAVLLLSVVLGARDARAQDDPMKQALAALDAAQRHDDSSLELGARTRLSAVYQDLGLRAKSLEALEPAGELVARERYPGLRFAFHQQLGVAYRGVGSYDEGLLQLEQALSIAETLGNETRVASVLNDIGLVHAARGETAQAIAAFDDSLAGARRAGDAALAATAGINLARASLDTGVREPLAERLEQSVAAIRDLSDSPTKAGHLLALGSITRDAQHRLGLPADWRKQAFAHYSAGLTLATELADRRLVAYGHGYIGALYEDEQRHDLALDYTRRAAFTAQAIQDDGSLYRWQWQIGRLLQAKGDVDGAITAYRATTETLGRLRPNLVESTTTTFRELAGPVFLELADLLLQRTAAMEDREAAQRHLVAVRDVLEQLKLAEVQEYFADECVLVQDDRTGLDRLSDEAAIFYPIVLAERTELLVSLPDGLRQFTSRVGTGELTEQIRQFRRRIDRYAGTHDYLPFAQTLHRWLIAPIEQALAEQNVDTLVVVPDGPLRTIPFSALHDGERFLIEKYAFATTPGLTLTSPQPIVRAGAQVLANGLTEGVQGFAPLPSVGEELRNIQRHYPTTVYQDESFLVDTVEQEISAGAYNIVHIATHGQFDRDHTKSFLLAYDDKLTLDRLQRTVYQRRYREEPVELLVLSACQTAAGDDRAALGLAGVALRAGARSALASLWFINDASTARLVAEFYAQLQDDDNSKAEALRKSQLSLMQDERYRHPSYWAPFLLIGNWL